jgi:hypothetical protein
VGVCVAVAVGVVVEVAVDVALGIEVAVTLGATVAVAVGIAPEEESSSPPHPMNRRPRSTGPMALRTRIQPF